MEYSAGQANSKGKKESKKTELNHSQLTKRHFQRRRTYENIKDLGLPGTTLDVSGALWEYSLLEYWHLPGLIGCAILIATFPS
jgi:hypothetical protein